jgi:hypothetical protein
VSRGVDPLSDLVARLLVHHGRDHEDGVLLGLVIRVRVAAALRPPLANEFALALRHFTRVPRFPLVEFSWRTIAYQVKFVLLELRIGLASLT